MGRVWKLPTSKLRTFKWLLHKAPKYSGNFSKLGVPVWPHDVRDPRT